MIEHFTYPSESTLSRILIFFSGIRLWGWMVFPIGGLIYWLYSLSNGFFQFTIFLDLPLLVFIGIAGILCINYQPMAIWVAPHEVQIAWDVFRRKTVKPEHIINIHRNLEAKNLVFVECTNLPWYTGFYGLIHLHRFARGFLIGRDIQGFQELLEMIRNGKKNNVTSNE